MAFNVVFYNFGKRDNSTKRPANGGVTVACNLKEESSLVAPTLLVHNFNNPQAYNYAYIPIYNRYYFISDWVYMLGNWECSLYTDVLATYKEYIGNSTQYVLRSSYEYDGRITDDLYPTVSIDESSMVQLGAPLAGNLSTGTYVIGVINRNGGFGAVEYFALSASEFADVCGVMFANNPTWYDLTNIVKSTPTDITEIALPTEVMKSLVNPMQYVSSCMFFPDAANIPTGGTEDIRFGWWNSEIRGHKLGSSGRSHKDIEYTIPEHPQASGQSGRGNYLNLSPYTRVMINAGLFGYFPIDTTFFADTLAGTMTIGIDAITGEGTLFVRNDEGHIISVHRAQVGVPIRLAQITRDYLQTAANVVNTAATATGSIAGTIGSILTGNVAGAVEQAASGTGQVVNGIVSSVKAAMPTLTASGSGGSLFELNRGWTITAQHFLLAEEDNDNLGRPLAKKKKISDVPGYLMIRDPDIATNGIGTETAVIRRYMAGGFFYE